MSYIGTKLRDPINSGLTRWRVAVFIKWTPPRESGGITRVSTRFNLSVETEQAAAGRDGRTRLVRPNSQLRKDREIIIFPVQLTTSRIGNLTRLIFTLPYVMSMHKYIPTSVTVGISPILYC